MAVEEPFEIYDVDPGVVLELNITAWEDGYPMDMTRKDGTRFTQAPLRLYLDKPLEPGRMPYLDITGKRLRAVLLPELMAGKYREFTLRLEKVGSAPRALFPFEWIPKG